MKLGVAGIHVLLSSCASHAGASSEPSEAQPTVTSESIVHGAPDRGRHPAVVALVVDDGAGRALCSGALVAPDVVLTARHCVAHLRTSSVVCPADRPQVGAPREPSSVVVVSGEAAYGGRILGRGREIVTTSGSALCDADLALVRLDRSVADIAPLAVDRGRGPRLGQRIVAVGFGQTGPGTSAGVRRFRTDVPILSLTQAELVVGESTCSGDSGSPAIDEDTGEIVGVLSRGNVRCEGAIARNVYTRVSPWLPLIDSVAKPGPSVPRPAATDVGDPCRTAGSCASGLCLLPSGSSRFGYCTRRCGAEGGRCPEKFSCAAVDGGAVCARRVP